MTIQTSILQGTAARAPARFSLSVLAVAAALTQSAIAQEKKMAETVVTATRAETKLDETLADVRVITKEQIENSGGRSLAEVLQRFAGARISSNGGRGQTQSINLRGSSQVILLVDGARFGSATAGDASLQSLPLEQIERIEVVHGPASALYGSDAIGGVIQIFTKTGRGAASAFNPHASATYGSRGYKDANAGFAGAQQGWSYSLNVARVVDPGFSASNAKSPSYTFNPDADKFNQTSVTANVGYAFNSAWRLDANFMQADGYAESDTGAATHSWVDSDAGTRSLKLSGTLTPNWKTSLSVSRALDKQWNRDQTINTGTVSSSTFSTTQDEFKWGNEIKTGLGVVVAGLERLEQEITTSTAFEESKRATNAAYAGLNGALANHSWQINVRRDDSTQYGSYNTWGISYGYEISPHLRVHASRASSLRAPTFNDLYYPNSGNPLLKPEVAQGNELGVNWSLSQHQFKLIGFDNKVENLIAWAPIAPESWTWKPANVNQARLKGWSLQYRWDLQSWNIHANYERLSARDGNGAALVNRAKHQATLALDKQLGAWKLGASALYVGDRQRSATETMASYTTLDAYAQYEMAKDWAVQVRVANLSNKTYETAYGYNQPGRAGYITLKWTPK